MQAPRLILGLTAALLLAACAAKPGTPGGATAPAAPAAPAETRLSAVYDCGAERIAARFGGGGVTVGLPDGRSLTLPRAGGRYSNGSISFWEAGGLANVETPTGSWKDCRPLS